MKTLEHPTLSILPYCHFFKSVCIGYVSFLFPFFINQVITTQKMQSIYTSNNIWLMCQLQLCDTEPTLAILVSRLISGQKHTYKAAKLLLRLCFSLSLFENDWTAELRHGVRGSQTQDCPGEEQLFDLGLCFSCNIVGKSPSFLLFYS